jgi:type I restriction enzyme S subunit
MSKKSKKSIEEMLEEAIVPEEEQPHELPENWLWSKLQFVADWGSGGTPKSTVPEYYDGNIPWLVIGDLNDYVVYDSARTITDLGLRNSSAKLIKEGSILIAMYGSIGKLGIAGVECTSNQAIAFTKKYYPNIVPKYLFFYLLSIRKKLMSLGKGGTQQNISQTVLKEVSIPLPPIYEQRRIAEKVESLIKKVEEVKQLIEETKETFELRRAAILDKAFQGELTSKWREKNGVQYSWRNIKLGELIKEGPQNGLYKPQSAYGEGVLIVRIDNFYNGKINEWETLKRLMLNENEIKLYRLCNNELIINRVNSIEYLGKSALVRNLEEPCVFESNVMRLRVNETVHPEYLVLYLNSNKGLKELRKNAKHAINQASINQQDVKNATVPLPRIDEQLEIVAIIKSLLEREQESAKFIDLNNKLSILKSSILSKAFRGELGTNDPTEENAIELLKKIVSQ